MRKLIEMWRGFCDRLFGTPSREMIQHRLNSVIMQRVYAKAELNRAIAKHLPRKAIRSRLDHLTTYQLELEQMLSKK